MQTRTLGKNGPHVSAIGLGCMGMSEFYGPGIDEESIKVIHRAVELGCTLLDSSDMYGNGHNEELLGHAIAGNREDVFLSTKFGYVRDQDGKVIEINGRPEFVRKSCDASLRRLKTDYIDLYYQHRVDRRIPIEETWQAMAELVKVGKVRYLGISEATPSEIRRAANVHAIVAGQYEYSLWERGIESEVISTCRELGIGLVAYSPLGRGFLTGTYSDEHSIAKPGDARSRFPRFQGENLRKNRDWLSRISAFAQSKGCTPAQIALAWVLSRGKDIIPIPGTKRLDRLDENLSVFKFHLSLDEIQCLDHSAPVGIASGNRYHDEGMSLVGI